MQTELSDIGEVIKGRRKILRLKQEDLAEMSGIGLRTIHDVENGTGNPSFQTLTKIVEVLGLSISVKLREL